MDPKRWAGRSMGTAPHITLVWLMPKLADTIHGANHTSARPRHEPYTWPKLATFQHPSKMRPLGTVFALLSLHHFPLDTSIPLYWFLSSELPPHNSDNHSQCLFSPVATTLPHQCHLPSDRHKAPGCITWWVLILLGIMKTSVLGQLLVVWWG